MRKSLLLTALFFVFLSGKAQNSGQSCGTGRYSSDVFISVTETSGIVFGQNNVTNYASNTSTPQTLRLDFYEPEGDAATQRPLVILAFGGGFVQGNRGDMRPIAIALAKKGYAVASIDYRLIENEFFNLMTVANSEQLMIDQVIKAAADMKAAIRFFKADAATANTYRIDPTKIFVGGASAGAIAALQVAYTDDIDENPATTAAYNDNGGLEGDTDLEAPNNLLPTYSASGIAGVLNIAGGVLDVNIIDANDPPLYSVHGDADDVVPYTSGTMSYDGMNASLMLYGSGSIATRSATVGLTNELFTIIGGGHESPSVEPNISQLIAEASTFMQTNVCGVVMPVTLTSFTVKGQHCSAVLNWQTATEWESSHYAIEHSTDGIRFSTLATVKSKNAVNGASYSYQVNETAKSGWFRLKAVDRDGSFAYSAIRGFTAQCNPQVQAYPNPAQNKTTVSGLEAGMQVDVLTADGKRVWSQKAAGMLLDIPLANFSKGLLLIQVRDVNGAVISNVKLMKN